MKSVFFLLLYILRAFAHFTAQLYLLLLFQCCFIFYASTTPPLRNLRIWAPIIIFFQFRSKSNCGNRATATIVSVSLELLISDYFPNLIMICDSLLL